MVTKRCSKCGVEKSESGFFKDKRYSDGLGSYCKECKRVYEKSTYHNESSGRREYLKEWRQSPKGKEMERKRGKIRYQQNRERMLAKAAVARAIAREDLPPVSTQQCMNCGEQAAHYHHDSYLKQDQLNVTPLCVQCHSDRH